MPFVPQSQEKCTACDRTVYATEKVIVETKEKKFPYHKTCIRCAHCNQVLSLGALVAHQSKFYCKPHFKQLFSSKGNYEEGFGEEKNTAKWDGKGPVPTTPPASFIPATEGEKKPVEKKETSEETANKIRQWRQEGNSELCDVCQKTVYLAEKLIVEERNKKKLYHKNCFKCTTCEIVLDLRNYGSHKEKIYCKNHLKEQLEINKPASSAFVNTKASFIPETEKGEAVKEKSETPEHIKEKFRSFSSQTEKCTGCNKTVYATERIIVEELKVQKPYHKTCLRCSHCNVQLDLSTYGSSKGTIYCLVHLKEIAKPQQAKDNSFFVSPLKKAGSGPGSEDNPTSQESEQQESREETQESRQEDNSQREDEEQARRQEEEREERARRQEEEERARQQEEQQETQQQQKQEESKSSSSADPEEEERERRRKEREDRRKQLEEEEKREEEERQRRAAERKKRLEALKSDE